MAPLLANLRGKFAEFLNNASPVRLGTFILVHQCRFAVRLPILFVKDRSLKQLEDFPGRLIQQIGFPKVAFTSQLAFIPQAGNTSTDLPVEASLLLVPQSLRGLLFQSPHSIASISSTGILTCCPSHTLFSLCLGPTNPWLTDIAMET